MSKTILIAEDDPAIVEVMEIILKEAGYATTVLKNGKRVIETVKKINPDLLLLDIWLSGEDGGDIAKKLKKDTATKKTPIIVMSANNETEQIAKESGANGFLKKPFDIDDFLKIVASSVKH